MTNLSINLTYKTYLLIAYKYNKSDLLIASKGAANFPDAILIPRKLSRHCF